MPMLENFFSLHLNKIGQGRKSRRNNLKDFTLKIRELYDRE